MNTGTFEKDKYVKKVQFSKAVLWKDRQISLPPSITKQFKLKGTKFIIFEDLKKNERWSVDYKTAKANAILKQEGQESQFYLPIEIFDVSEIKPTTEHDFESDVKWFDNELEPVEK